MFTRISTFIKENQAKILSTIGVLTVIALVVIAIYQSINYISGLRGFNFDPFLLIGIIIFVYYFNGILRNQNQILAKQQALLEKLLATNTTTNSAISRSRPKTTTKRIIKSRKISK